MGTLDNRYESIIWYKWWVCMCLLTLLLGYMTREGLSVEKVCLGKSTKTSPALRDFWLFYLDSLMEFQRVPGISLQNSESFQSWGWVDVWIYCKICCWSGMVRESRILHYFLCSCLCMKFPLFFSEIVYGACKRNWTRFIFYLSFRMSGQTMWTHWLGCPAQVEEICSSSCERLDDAGTRSMSSFTVRRSLFFFLRIGSSI